MDDLGELLQTLTLYDRLNLAVKQAEEEEEAPLPPVPQWGQEREAASAAPVQEYPPQTWGAGTEVIGSASPVYGNSAEASPLRQAEKISRYFERDARRYG